MSRPRHSFAGQIRALQISRFSLFAFVEGKDADAHFFGQVCGRVCEPRGMLYRVQTARELPGGVGGKNRLVDFYRYARSNGQLRSVLNGKLSVLVFFLDKDVDDIKRTKCRSKHVVYTAHYDVQNYIFRHGDFFRSVSAAASIDRHELTEHPDFGGDWREKAARRWKDWVVLCLFSVVRLSGRVAHYGNASKVNRPLNGPVDPALRDQHLAAAQNASGLGQAEFDLAIRRLTRRVEGYLTAGTYDLVFKGKWYRTLLEEDLKTAFPGRGQMQNVGARATTALLATLDFNQSWAERLVGAVADLLE